MNRLLITALTATLMLGFAPAAAAATPTCFGHTATIVGTNTANPQPEYDVIVALGGGDTIYSNTTGWIPGPEGETPHEHACGGDGPDKMYGDSGGDVMGGDRGNDLLVGGDMHDSLIGGAGADVLKERIAGDPHGDYLRGGRGNDTLYADNGPDGPPDTIHGGVGTDTCYVDRADHHHPDGQYIFSCEKVIVR